MMAVMMMSAITDDDLFRAGTVPARPAFSGLCLHAGSVAAAADLAAFVPGLTAGWRAPFGLRSLPGFRRVLSKRR
jgi:hypothetical protein